MTEAALLNHLWQSTAFAAAAAGLAFALRRHQARVRFWIWMTASLKFLVPFAALTELGRLVSWPQAALAPVPALVAASAPFPANAPVLAGTLAGAPASAGHPLFFWLLLASGAGSAGLLARWARRWRRLSRISRAAVHGELDGLAIRTTPGLLEPGLFGILRPVLLLPSGIESRLDAEQLRAVLAHERCHLRRRDNLWSAMHMAVESLFWFHPLVWWMGARLVAERERACDEEVLRRGGDREAYAGGILAVCRFYAESPLACAAGISGGELKQRVGQIMQGHWGRNLGRGYKLLLCGLGVAALAGPLAAGIVFGQGPQNGPPHFDVISIRPIPLPRALRPFAAARAVYPGGRYSNHYAFFYSLLSFAYPEYTANQSLSGAPAWAFAHGDYFDVEAEAVPHTSPGVAQMRLMMRSLLAARFGLKFHTEHRVMPVYFLEIAKGGTRNVKPSAAGERFEYPARLLAIRAYGATASAVTMADIASVLSSGLDRPVLDRTGITGRFDFDVPRPPNKNLLGTPQESLFSALRGKLGLNLIAGKARVPVMVVDQLHRPTPN